MKSEWKYGNSFPIDISFDDPWDALELPKPPHGWGEYWDYIFSSHCLEHLPNWVEALDYWHTRLRVGGVVFLYLPDHSQTYWRPWNNRKHIHCLTPEIVGNYFLDQPEMWTNVFISGVDLNNSFTIIAEKV
jgi:SAM-dependent methyltransferase